MDMKSLIESPPWEWPEETGASLLRLLKDKQAQAPDRLIAAECAGEFTIIDEEIAEALLAVLTDGEEPDALRARAAIALGPALEHGDICDFDDPDEVILSEETLTRFQAALHTLYRDPGIPAAVRRSVLEASVRMPQEWHEDAVRAAYADGEAAWRLTAVFCMQYIEGFDEQIMEAIRSEDPDIHYFAVEAAGNWEVDGAWTHVVELATAEKTEKTLRMAAIDAVGAIRHGEAVDVLSDMVEHEDEDIADAAYEALAMSDDSLLFGNGEYDDDGDGEDEDDDD